MIDEFRGETRWLSNFHYIDIEYDGITYPSTEHAYQAQKSLDPKIRKIFSKLRTCGEAKKLGEQIRMREDWEEVKFGIMYGVCKIKFQKEPLKSMLLATGKQKLIEGNTWNDTYWGVCNGIGENNLGKILMGIRSELTE